MYGNGILMLFKGFSKSYVSALCKKANSLVNGRLYITLDGLNNTPGCLPSWSRVISSCYSAADEHCPNLDIRLILPTATYFPIDRGCKVVLVDDPSVKEKEIRRIMMKLSTIFPHNVVFTETEFTGPDETWPESSDEVRNHLWDKKSSQVCMGGTFDHLHNGHKLLLGVASVATRQKLTVGVTEDTMLKRKLLSELIQPLDVRMHNVSQFLGDTCPGVDYNVVRLTDPYGPSIEDSRYTLIVASEETKKGCEKINEIRIRHGFPTLEITTVPFLEDTHGRDAKQEESKVSSSSHRLRLLGTLLKPPHSRSKLQTAPYVIGLTGGIASGKTTIAKKLGELGAGIVDCDLLGHEIYRSGTGCFYKVVAQFGTDILAAEGEIDRKKLSKIVFSDAAELKKLSKIVWPEILRQALQLVDELSQTGHSVVVLDAAVLLDAGWQENCDEVWTATIPPHEAVRRIMERDGLSSEDAQFRLDRQMDNYTRVQLSHVVFCSLWDYDYTKGQVKKAWNLLQERLPASLQNT